MKFKNLLIVFILILLMTGCSRIKFAYNQLDWLIPFYLGSIIDLSAQQDADLQKQVDSFLSWHCNHQLKQYADLLRTANSDLQADRISVNRLEEFSLQIEDFWVDMKKQVYPGFARLLQSSNNQQLRQLFEELDEKNREWLAEYKSQTKQDLINDYQENMIEMLEYWIGPLEEKQIQIAKTWSGEFVPLGLEGFEMRKNWQTKLRELTVHRKDAPAFYSEIEHLFLEPKKFRSPAYQKRLDSNRKKTILLIVEIANNLTVSQKKHLNNQALSIAQDFDDLSCNKYVPKNTTAELLPVI